VTDESKPSGLLPFVRHMVLCEHAEASPNNPRKTNILGVITRAVVTGNAADFPRNFGFTVYLLLTECRGDGRARIIVSEGESQRICYAGPAHALLLGPDPLALHEVIIRVPKCQIPQLGIYLVEFEFEGVVLSQESFSVAVR